MKITEVRIRVCANQSHGLLAVASAVLDGCLVINDIKLVQGADDRFIVMPSRPLYGFCAACGSREALVSSFCPRCGKPFRPSPPRPALADGVPYGKLFVDVVFPNHPALRETIRTAVAAKYAEQEAALCPGPLPT